MTECEIVPILAAIIVSLVFLLIISVILILMYRGRNKVKSVENSLYSQLERDQKKIELLINENEMLMDYFIDFAKVISRK